LSLRLRLALWYGGLTTLIVALVCVYSYALQSRTQYDEIDRVLHGVAEHVADELETAPGQGRDILLASLTLGTAIRVLDREGQVTAQSPTATSVPAIDLARVVTSGGPRPYAVIGALAPALHAPKALSGRYGLLTNASGDRFRVYVLPMQGESEFLAAVTPLAPIDRAVAGFARLMLAMALLGGLIAFIVGWLIARHALQPVVALTDTAAAIAESRQHSRRVAEGSPRDELGRLARTFNTMLASLDDSYEAQVRFVAAASHELRAPLTVVQANLDLLASGRISRDERAAALAEAHAEASRMGRLVADLLALARADAGVPIRRDVVELDRIVLQVVGETRHMTRGQRVEITAIQPVLVRGDPDQLKQLTLNVIENAIKYTPADGRIAIAIERDRTHALVTVSDTGIGIAAEHLPRIFERFFRADPVRARNPGGSGLGLSIAMWVATEHGGTIDVTSAPGRGSTFTIRLPAA
jgi:two-component system OmpR family sensor kinase